MMFAPNAVHPNPSQVWVYRSLPARLWFTVRTWRKCYRSDRWVGNQAVGALRVAWHTANYPVASKEQDHG